MSEQTDAAPKKKSGKGKWIIGGIAAVVILGVIGSLGGTKGGAAAPTPADSSTPTQAVTPTQPSAPAQPVVLLTASGNGIKSLKPFTTTGDWTLAYTYDCTKFGFQGNFVVTDKGDNFDIYVNALGKHGQDTTNPTSVGKVVLDVNSECAWTIKATQP